MDNQIVIEKLKADNYATWLKDIKAVLMERNCYKIVIGSEVKPGGEAATPKDIRDFNQRSDRAYSLIYLHIESEYRTLISDTENPKEAWDKLKTHFRPDSRARVIGLMDEFFSCRPHAAEEVGLYAARLKSISTQLKDAGKDLDEYYRAFQLIRYLPPEFSGIVQAIYRWEDEKFTFDKILQELLAEESRLKQAQKDLETVALQTKTENTTEITSKGYAPRRRGRNRKQSRTTIPDTSFIIESCGTECNDVSWCIDSASTRHFTCNKSLFSDFKPIKNLSMTAAIHGATCQILGTGTIYFRVFTQGEWCLVKLNNVLYSPSLRRNLISGPLIDKAGGSFICKQGKITVYAKEGHKLFEASKRNGLYIFKPNYQVDEKLSKDKCMSKVKSEKKNSVNKTKKVSNVKPKINNVNSNVKQTKINAFSISPSAETEIWHKRFCHINPKYIVQTSKRNAVKGLPELKFEKLNCNPCKLAKTCRKSFKPIGSIRSTKVLELLHMDLCGPLPNVAIGGYRYFLSITDDFSRKVTTYPVKEKKEVFDCFKRYQKRVERFLNSKILNIRTDNGMEFCHSEFERFLEEQGIKAERTNYYTPEQDGVSERFNYTALDAVKTLLNSSGLSQGFWAEALLCYTYVWNRVCHGNQNLTPFELFSGRKPSVNHLRPFGLTAYIGVPRQLRKKLDMRAKKGIMVGYAMKTRGYRIWIPQDKRILETINVTFEGENEDSGAVMGHSSTVTRNFFRDPDSESDTDEENIPIKRTEDSFPPKHEVKSVSETENETPSTSRESDEESRRPPKHVIWIREAVPRRDGLKTDIYYKVQGTKIRLRSHHDVIKYCDHHNISYNKNMFNFSGKNTYSGIVKSPESNQAQD